VLHKILEIIFIVYLLSFLVVDVINTQIKNAYANICIDESFTIGYNMHLKNKEGDFFFFIHTD